MATLLLLVRSLNYAGMMLASRDIKSVSYSWLGSQGFSGVHGGRDEDSLGTFHFPTGDCDQ